ncbi:hypothetical protein ACOBQX_26005 [Actinokineospora sp. G85]|uniref:hypothetical protein n=1 Tax=Actinokineospora sp. G85 TaxID=3406626 RepID=UPI003C75DD06
MRQKAVDDHGNIVVRAGLVRGQGQYADHLALLAGRRCAAHRPETAKYFRSHWTTHGFNSR